MSTTTSGKLRTADGPKPVFDLVSHSSTASGKIVFSFPWGDVVVTGEDITPDIAADWLERYNTANRNMQKERVSGHFRDMVADNWWFVGDTIRFGRKPDGEDVLLDGQHRLAAIVKSETTQPYIVVRGLPIDASEAIDTGKVRSVPDTLRLRAKNGGKIWADENNVAAIGNRLLLWERDIVPAMGPRGRAGGSGGSRQATKHELLDYIDNHADEIQDALGVVRMVRNGSFSISPSALATAWALLARVDRVGADLFVVEHFVKGLHLEDTAHPAAALRRRLGRDDRWAPPYGEGFMLVLKAWNHWRNSEKVERLQAPRTGWPKPSEFHIR
jgi:hypothetical protein